MLLALKPLTPRPSSHKKILSRLKRSFFHRRSLTALKESLTLKDVFPTFIESSYSHSPTFEHPISIQKLLGKKNYMDNFHRVSRRHVEWIGTVAIKENLLDI